MSRWTAFGLGMLARLLSTLAASYATWLFRRIVENGDELLGFLDDIRAFARWLLRGAASQFCGAAAGDCRYGSAADEDDFFMS